MVHPTRRSAAPQRRTTTSGLRLGLGLALAAGLTLPLPAMAQKGGGVTITSLGHSALMIQGGGARVLVNPFQAVGCAAGLPEPRVSADVILASSLLKDEGAQVASGKFLVKPGSYRLAGLQIEGIAAPHDRVGGRRFGNATLWRWRQGGLDIAHLGGTAGSLSPADRVLLGRPDVLIIGVGGGGKVYTGQEAAEVVRELQARRVIPVQYNGGKPPANCDQGSVEPFLKAMAGATVRRSGRSVSLVPPLGDGVVVEVLR
ncbi:MBL fold metallo-hydrolase [Cyanobium sp. N5-Cardenillas]|uniref:MBL fold metallo-hydrolase n=1 Tax=Cyanobium sp. N5-Cardenillas TaxID=2823720 RepID=UPI0039656D22|nr:MBL fold metallo-hydrolase [Cyanobium sp. N5-Cardenillas]